MMATTSRSRLCGVVLLLCPWTLLYAGSCPDLDPVPDGGTVPDLIISAIDPGEWIEVFNPNDTPFDFDASNGDLCEPFAYRRFDAIAPGTVLPPLSYARLPWPANFTQSSDAGGQIIIYNVAAGHAQDNIADFVCWGTGDGDRKSQAEAVGKWTGACAPAISPGQTIRRLVTTTGTDATAYDTNAPPQNCAEAPPFGYEDGFEDPEL